MSDLDDKAVRNGWTHPEGLDPRAPDYSRKGVFIDHNCTRCDSGAKPCIKSNPRDCETLHARND